MEMGKMTRGDRSEVLKPGVAIQAGKAQAMSAPRAPHAPLAADYERSTQPN